MPSRCLLLLLVASALLDSASAQAPNHLDHVHTPATYDDLDAWERRADWLRDHIAVSLGLVPMPERTPLNPILSPPAEGEGYTVQQVVLETLPGFYLTGTLYRPLSGEGPFPAILSPHGHWQQGRFEHTDAASIPGRAITFARQGYVVLNYSMIGYNETSDAFPHRFDAPGYQLWGFSAMGLQLWNSLRALDYVAALPDVDAARIGMTGASGGGTQTFMLTAIDDRIAAAAPVNMISAHFQGGCICENGPLLRIDAHNVEIAALAAPRPLMMISTAGDWTVNTPDVEFPAIRQVYAHYGAGDRVSNVHFSYPHNYNRDSRAAVYPWFARWLTPARPDLPEAPGLALTPADTRPATLPAPPRSPDALFAAYRQDAANRLIADTPRDTASLRRYRERYGSMLRHVLHRPASAWTDRLMYFPPTETDNAHRAVLIVHPGDPASARTARSLARQHQIGGQLAAILTPFPEGSTFVPPDAIDYWTTYNPAVPVTRIGEIQDAIAALRARPDVDRIDVIGLGEAGVWTLFAHALSPDVHGSTIHMNGVDYAADEEVLLYLPVPLIRRAGDVRTAVAMIAPAPLTITHLPDGDLAEWIRSLYRMLDAEHLLHITH